MFDEQPEFLKRSQPANVKKGAMKNRKKKQKPEDPAARFDELTRFALQEDAEEEEAERRALGTARGEGATAAPSPPSMREARPSLG